MMEAIRLEFQPEIKEKILKLLSSFSTEELRIVEEDSFSDSNFEEEKMKLKERVKKINDGEAEYSSFEELDAFLEDTIKKYED